jgi:surfactin synthase thioesterase subunit
MAALVEGVVAAIRSRLDVPYVFFWSQLWSFGCFRVRESAPQAGIGWTGFPRSGSTPGAAYSGAARAHWTPTASGLRCCGAGAVQWIPFEVLNDMDRLDLLVPTLRADIQLLEAYRFVKDAPFEFPIMCLGGSTDSEANTEDLDGWRQHTVGPFELHMFAGGHFFLQSAEVDLLRAMTKHLADICGRGAPGFAFPS